MKHNTHSWRLHLNIRLTPFSKWIRDIFLRSELPVLRPVIRRKRGNVLRASKYPGELADACKAIGCRFELYRGSYVIRSLTARRTPDHTRRGIGYRAMPRGNMARRVTYRPN